MSVTQDLRAELDAANNKCIALQYELSIAEATIKRLSATTSSSDAETKQLIRELIACAQKAPGDRSTESAPTASSEPAADTRHLALPTDKNEPFKQDDPVMVRDSDGHDWVRRYYHSPSNYGDGCKAWTNGANSWSTRRGLSVDWAQVRRPTPAELAHRHVGEAGD